MGSALGRRAAGERVAGVSRARVGVVAAQDGTEATDASPTDLARGARVCVVTGRSVGDRLHDALVVFGHRRDSQDEREIDVLADLNDEVVADNRLKAGKAHGRRDVLNKVPSQDWLQYSGTYNFLEKQFARRALPS